MGSYMENVKRINELSNKKNEGFSEKLSLRELITNL
jgi:uncharacterized protein YnzC (UPF0291/DUF896 family)